jgi:hypothetical protein
MKKEEKSTPIIYQIFAGDELDEYYSLTVPLIEGLEVNCKNLIKKSSVTENIIGEDVSEHYSTTVEDKSFSLKEGFSVKVLTATPDWMNSTEEQAQNRLKERVLHHYQNIVPTLMENVKLLRDELNKVKQRQQQQQQPIYGQHRSQGGNLMLD